MKQLSIILNNTFTALANKGPKRVDISAPALRECVGRVRNNSDVLVPMKIRWSVIAEILKQTPNANGQSQQYKDLGDLISSVSNSITRNDTFYFYAVEKDAIKAIAANLDLIEKASQNYRLAVSSGKMAINEVIQMMPANEIPHALERFTQGFKKIMEEAKVEAPANTEEQTIKRGGGIGWRNGGAGFVLSRK